MNAYKCHWCKEPIKLTQYIRLRWEEATRVQCQRCGANHTILRGEIEVISPQMQPVNAMPARALSPWQLPKFRPITHGYYECKFYDTDEAVLELWWNGRYFQPEHDDTRRVALRTLKTWRGAWL